MEQQLKQRLIGVTVIVALVVIFVPMLFDKTGDRQAAAPEGIPPIPEDVVETKPIELPKSAEDMAEKEKDKEALPASGYKIIPLTDEPQPVAKPKSADTAQVADAAPAADEEAPVEEDDGAAAEGEGAAPVAEAPTVTAPPRTVKLEPLEDPRKPKTPTQAKTEAGKPKTVTKPEPVKPADPAQKPLAKTSKPESAPAAKAAGEKGVPAAWVVQTGSFQVESKANALVEKLRQSRYPAFIERVQGDGGTLFRVKVGPELDRARAEQMQKQIETSVGLKGIVIPQR